MTFFQLWLSLWLFMLKDLHLTLGIAVTFPNKEPLLVALGRTLVLEAQFQLQPNEKIILLTWELKNSDGEVRVAEDLKPNNNRTSVEKDGALLRIQQLKDSDCGIYKITVTASNGDQVSDSREVIKITSPPSASLYMQCRISRIGAQWDSPKFSWQVDGHDVTSQESTDGSALLLKDLGRSYTCVTDSSQGRSEANVRVLESTPTPTLDSRCSCSGLIVVVVLETIAICAIIIWLCYKTRRQHKERGTDPR